MDMTGDVPRQAWVEIYDEDCKLLVKLDSHISGGSISTKFPAFAAGTRGRIRDVWIYRDSQPVPALGRTSKNLSSRIYLPRRSSRSPRLDRRFSSAATLASWLLRR